jgi:hypothetical protein
MGFLPWVLANSQLILTDIGIIGGLLFTGFQMRSEAKTRRVSNLLTVTANHREIWHTLFSNPELIRILDRNVPLKEKRTTEHEEIFVITVILHLASVFAAQKDHLIVKEEGLRKDVWDFFSRPIPAAVWEKMKVLYNDDFVAYVESCRNRK